MIFKLPHRFTGKADGVALIEFAFVLPVLLLIFIGTVEISNFVYAGQKLQSAADNIANIVNLETSPSTDQMETISGILPEVVRPFNIGQADYRVHISNIWHRPEADGPTLHFHKSFGGANGGSIYGGAAEGQPTTVEGFTFAEGDQVTIVEVHMRYQPIFLDMPLMESWFGLQDALLYHKAPPMRPRVGAFLLHPDDESSF